MIWAVILAAGESKRMGEPKQLLPFGASTVIETVIENILRSSAEKTLVVLGAGHERMRSVIEKFPVDITVNPHFRRGMLSSVQWGIRRLPRQARAALVFLGDQPWISQKIIDGIIDAFKETGKGLVLPVYKNSGGHPLLIDLKYRDTIGRLSADMGLRELLSLYPEDIARVSVENPEILRDMDTPGDYKESK